MYTLEKILANFQKSWLIPCKIIGLKAGSYFCGTRVRIPHAGSAFRRSMNATIDNNCLTCKFFSSAESACGIRKR